MPSQGRLQRIFGEGRQMLREALTQEGAEATTQPQAQNNRDARNRPGTPATREPHDLTFG